MAPPCSSTSATAARHATAEHDEAGEVTAFGKPVAVAREVEVLQPQARQGAAGVEVVVQLLQGLDLHAPILTHRGLRRPHAASITGMPRRAAATKG